jgi:hypothetical protein
MSSVEVKVPGLWCCPVCQREARGVRCPNGHDLPSPARELLSLVQFLARSVEEPWVESFVAESLANLMGEEPS